MASRNKLEEQIKDRLNNREIIPSDRAWEQLSAELEGRGKSKRGFLWIAVAAVLIGLLVGSTAYFNTVRSTGIPETKIAEIPSSETRGEPDSAIIKEPTVTDAVGSKKDNRDLRVKSEMEYGAVVALDSAIGKTKSGLVALDKEMKIPEGEKMVSAQEVINNKIEEVIAQVALLEQTNTDLSDAEVDSLLRQAQRELFTNKIFRDDHSVDAMALLADVEGELDRSFREQLFELLKEGYFRARTAVAARNN